MPSELNWVWMWWSPASQARTGAPGARLAADAATVPAAAGALAPSPAAATPPTIPAARSMVRRDSWEGLSSRSGTEVSTATAVVSSRWVAAWLWPCPPVAPWLCGCCAWGCSCGWAWSWVPLMGGLP